MILFSGVGIKKMKAYKSDLSLEDLNKKRQKFELDYLEYYSSGN